MPIEVLKFYIAGIWIFYLFVTVTYLDLDPIIFIY